MIYLQLLEKLYMCKSCTRGWMRTRHAAPNYIMKTGPCTGCGLVRPLRCCVRALAEMDRFKNLHMKIIFQNMRFYSIKALEVSQRDQ